MKNPFGKFINIKKVEKDVRGSSKLDIHEKQHALETSIREGSASSFAAGISGTYITPFAIKLNPNPLIVGFLSAFSGLIRPLAQIHGSRLMRHHSRKKIVLKYVFLDAIFWLPIILIGIFYWFNLYRLYLPYALVFFFTLQIALSSIAAPAWFSWMGDLVPKKDRGKYFAARNRATGIVSIIAVLIGSLIIYTFEKLELGILGFSIIFAMSFFFRLISYYQFKKQFAPSIKIKKGDYFSFWQFIKKKTDYRTFSIYQGVFYFSIMIASPFFAVYMLEVLNMNIITFTIVSLTSSVFYLIFAPLAGKFGYRYGNVKLMWVGHVFFILTPVLWLFTKNPILIIAIPQLSSGIANAASTIAENNFTYDAVRQSKRGVCISYTSLLVGLGTFVGSLFGGFLLKLSPASSAIAFVYLFLIASGIRLLVAIIFLPQMKEVRKTQRLPPMKVELLHPFKAVKSEIGWFHSVFEDAKDED